MLSAAQAPFVSDPYESLEIGRGVGISKSTRVAVELLRVQQARHLDRVQRGARVRDRGRRMTSPAAELSVDATTGYLPRGRHRVNDADIRARFVDHADFTASTTRHDVWDEYELGRDLLGSKVRIHAIWIGGSFLTSKVDAKDLDALFIVSARDYRKLDAADQAVVASFIPRTGPLGTPVRGHGLKRLDSFLLLWAPYSPLNPKTTPDHNEYAVWRGYWDDFWQRDRHNKPDGIPPHWKDALPVRGYLEVELDDFAR